MSEETTEKLMILQNELLSFLIEDKDLETSKIDDKRKSFVLPIDPEIQFSFEVLFEKLNIGSLYISQFQLNKIQIKEIKTKIEPEKQQIFVKIIFDETEFIQSTCGLIKLKGLIITFNNNYDIHTTRIKKFTNSEDCKLNLKFEIKNLTGNLMDFETGFHTSLKMHHTSYDSCFKKVFSTFKEMTGFCASNFKIPKFYDIFNEEKNLYPHTYPGLATSFRATDL